MLTHGSLFAGIGGFDLGFGRAGIKTVWQVENDPYAVKILERRWPDVTRYDDITKIDFRWNRYSKRKFVEPEPVDILSGGFPCQDVSYAGKRKGLHRGTRSRLWLHFYRAVRQLRPRYVVVENVPGLFSLGFGDVLGDLAAVGYDAEWESIPAEAFGALHLRERLFLVAYPSSDLRRTSGDTRPPPFNGGSPTVGDPRRSGRRRVDGGRTGPELTNGRAVVSDAGGGGRLPGQRDVLPGQSDAVGNGTVMADADGKRCDRGAGVFETARAEGELPVKRGNSWWAVEPDVGRVADGVPARVDRLRTLGNAVVPQITEWLGRQITIHARRNGDDAKEN